VAAPPTSAKPNLAAARVRATQVGSLSEPLAMAWRAGDSTAYVAERGGRVRTLSGQTVLDLTSAVTTAGSEQGLLGLAFAPDGGHVYVDYTDTNGDTRVVEYAFKSGRADMTTRRQLLFVDQPFANHNGGQLVFTGDGLLWIGLGDGGSGGDPANNAQNLGTLLGKVLRIDPRPSGGQPYGIPRDNPFVGRAGARPEIWAYGLRNPWRFTFDRTTGDLWIGDVGQNAWEEVDFRSASSHGGENYGWSQVEGTHFFKGPAPAGSVPPVYEYPTQSGCAVTGGYVYRGANRGALNGIYVFADYCNGEVLGLLRNGKGASVRALGAKVSNLSSFGQGPAGELYALSLSGGVFRLDPA
jgi:glucose/arabinose dehydrogenase